MATNPMKTLFGDTEDTLLRQMRMEDQDRVNQARLLDKQSGGNYYSGLIADAAQQQANVFSNLLPKGVRAVGGLLGQEDVAGRLAAGMEDPRLGKARQRKADLDMLSKRYETLGSDEDGFTDKDAKTIVDDLMSLGYLKEAKQMAEIWQGRRKLDIDESLVPAKKMTAKAALQRARNAAKSIDKLKFEGPIMQDVKGNLWQAAYTEGGKRKMFLLSGNPDGAEYNEAGATVVNEKEMGKLQIQDSNSFIKAGNIAFQELPKMRKLLELVNLGAFKQGGLAKNINAVKIFLGMEPKNQAEFRTKTQRYLVENLKRIMGAKPTDKDLEELAKALANLGQSPEANKTIIMDIINKFEKEKEAGIYFTENPGATVATFNNYLRTKANQPQGKPDPLSIR